MVSVGTHTEYIENIKSTESSPKAAENMGKILEL